MGRRPLTGYHVWAFTIPVIVLHLPYVMGVEWTLAGELRTLATFFALAVVWDYLWFVLNPAYTVEALRAREGLVVRGALDLALPLDYYAGIAVSVGLAGLSAWAAGNAEPFRRHLWMLAGLAILVGLTVLAAPLYHRWYRHMRRPGQDDRGAVAPIRLRRPERPGPAGSRPAPRRRRENEMRKWPFALGAAAGAAGWGIYNAISPTAQGSARPSSARPAGKLMALTFDDGPNTAWTPQLLEVLDKHGVKRRSSRSATTRASSPPSCARSPPPATPSATTRTRT